VNAYHNVEVSRCHFFTTPEPSLLEVHSTRPAGTGQREKYTAGIMENCLRRLVSKCCKLQVHMVDDIDANQMANYLLSTKVNLDKSFYRKRELIQLTQLS
jgi:hypothetical protein